MDGMIMNKKQISFDIFRRLPKKNIKLNFMKQRHDKSRIGKYPQIRNNSQVQFLRMPSGKIIITPSVLLC